MQGERRGLRSRPRAFRRARGLRFRQLLREYATTCCPPHRAREEHEPYMLGELRIQGNARTKDKVIRREAVMAGLLPGEVLDKNRMILFEKRLKQLGYFMHDQQQGNRRDDPRARGPLAIRIAVRRGVERQSVRSFTDRQIAIDSANSRMRGVNPAINHRDLDTGARAAAPRPLARDVI